MLIKRALLIAAAATLLTAPALAAGDDASSSSPGPRSRKTVGRCSAVRLCQASRRS